MFEVDGVEVDLSEEMKTDPALRDAGERVHYLLPPCGGEGKVVGPLEKGDLLCTPGARILTLDLLTGEMRVTQAQ